MVGVPKVLIVNPFASGVTERKLAAVLAALPAGTETVLTQARGEATDLAAEWSSRAEAIYVFSGDGTYNEVINGIRADIPLGLIPGGGTSVLPRALGLPRDPVRAAERIAHGKPRRISLGRLNGRRFAFNAGIGFDAELVRRVDGLGRRPDGKRPGDIAFAWTIVRTLSGHGLRYESALEVEGLGRAAFALVANCSPYTYAGRLGLRLAPKATFEGGLDIVAPVEVRARAIPRLAAQALRGRPAVGDVLLGHDLDRILIRCDKPLPVQVDGEDIGDMEEAEIVAERDALTVLT
jgi:diacylglycerol kinase family enzyme